VRPRWAACPRSQRVVGPTYGRGPRARRTSITAAPTRWLALLPASKGIDPFESDPPWGAVAGSDQLELLDLVGDHDDADDDRPVSARGTAPAWRRYDGVVHRAADVPSLDAGARRRWRRHVAYVSAVGGLVRATDPLPPYRLEMATVTEAGGLGPWWRPRITAELEHALTASGVLWLLTGGEYGRAVEAPAGRTVVEPRFLRAAGSRAMPSATVKQARGQLARALVEHPALARAPLDDGWRGVRLEAAGRPVVFDGVEDGTPVWRSAASA
jgi:hypothetical protein